MMAGRDILQNKQKEMTATSPSLAGAKQRSNPGIHAPLDCFIVTLFAMTERVGEALPVIGRRAAMTIIAVISFCLSEEYSLLTRKDGSGTFEMPLDSFGSPAVRKGRGGGI
jgi:hypothetical protein